MLCKLLKKSFFPINVCKYLEKPVRRRCVLSFQCNNSTMVWEHWVKSHRSYKENKIKYRNCASAVKIWFLHEAIYNIIYKSYLRHSNISYLMKGSTFHHDIWRNSEDPVRPGGNIFELFTLKRTKWSWPRFPNVRHKTEVGCLSVFITFRAK